MQRIKLLQMTPRTIKEFEPCDISIVEFKSLIERNVETLFKSSLITKNYELPDGTVADMGIDGLNRPVVFMYQEAELPIIVKAFKTIDWLNEHKAEFKLLIMESTNELSTKLSQIKWENAYVICIGEKFLENDIYLARKHNTVQLAKFQYFGDGFYTIEILNDNNSNEDNDGEPVFVKSSIPVAYNPVNSPTAKAPDMPMVTVTSDTTSQKVVGSSAFYQLTHTQRYEASPDNIQKLYDATKSFITGLGTDVEEHQNKTYPVFKRSGTTFISVEILNKKISAGLVIDSADVGEITKNKTYPIRIDITDMDGLEKAKSSIKKSYMSIGAEDILKHDEEILAVHNDIEVPVSEPEVNPVPTEIIEVVEEEATPTEEEVREMSPLDKDAISSDIPPDELDAIEPPEYDEDEDEEEENKEGYTPDPDDF